MQSFCNSDQQKVHHIFPPTELVKKMDFMLILVAFKQASIYLNPRTTLKNHISKFFQYIVDIYSQTVYNLIIQFGYIV